MEIESIKKSHENSNQWTIRMSYVVKFLSWPIHSGMEVSWLLLSQRLSKEWSGPPRKPFQKNPHTEHDRASCDCNAVSRSFPYAFHLPSPQYSSDMVPVRDLQKRRKEAPSMNHLKLKPSTHCPQPATRVSTHLSRLKLEAGARRNPRKSRPSFCHAQQSAGGSLLERSSQRFTLTHCRPQGLHYLDVGDLKKGSLRSKRRLCDARS